MSIYETSLDLKKSFPIYNDPIILRQGDTNVKILVHVFDNSTPKNLENLPIEFHADKPDATTIDDDEQSHFAIGADKQSFTYTVPDELTDASGSTTNTYFKIGNDSTSNFYIHIMTKAGMEKLESGDYISKVDRIFNHVMSDYTAINNIAETGEGTFDTALAASKKEMKDLMDNLNAEYVQFINSKTTEFKTFLANLDSQATDVKTKYTALKAQLDALEVPVSAVGTNLLLNTNVPFSMTGNNKNNQGQTTYSLSRRLEARTTVTLSFDAVSTAPAPFNIRNDGGNGGTWMSYIETDTVDTTKKHFVETITLNGFSDLGVKFKWDNVPSTTTVTISNMKLELGSHATDWCPNPTEVLTQSNYAKIKAGITPTIDDKGHWKIGNTITQYSAGVKDFDDSATLLNINTDKAYYYPSEKVTFHATSVSGHGHLVVNYYNLNNLIATKDVYYGTSELSWSWFLPSTDNVGYSVVIKNYVGENNESDYRFAINVSSDPYNYPIMGFLSKYDTDSPVERKQNLDYLKRLHINLVQFYDWFDLHSLPLPVSSNGDSVQVSNTWTDIGNRLTRIRAIEGYCNLAKEYAMKPLAYMAMNGSDTNQLVHGLTAEMFLYNDNSKSLDSVYKTLDKNKDWGKYSLYSMNWMNGPWQEYIDNQMRIVRDNMPFDGWHIDMFGNPGNKYDSNGNELSSSLLESSIHYFLDSAAKLGWDIGVNSVGEYGINDMKPVTALKYLYTEVWDNRKTYDDMFRLVRGLTESTDSNKKKKGVIAAAYMNYEYAKNNSGKDFNIDGVILADLVIMASGGTHLEMGEHMLCNEYFPNSNLNLPTQLSSDYLPKIYDFFVAFKEIIGLGYQVDGLATIENGSVDSLQSGNVCGISYGNAHGYLGLSLINLKTANTEWQDTNATCRVTPAENIKVTLKLEVTNHDWYYFDLEHLEPQKLDVGADGIVNITELHYFGFILGVPKK